MNEKGQLMQNPPLGDLTQEVTVSAKINANKNTYWRKYQDWQIDRQTDGRIDGWMDRQTDRWTDRQIDVVTKHVLLTRDVSKRAYFRKKAGKI